MDFNSIVRDKSVALIGGADEINWTEVEKCDLVARVNSHWSRQGGRCNILYFSCARDLEFSMFEKAELWSQLKFVLVNLSHTLFGSIAAERARFVISLLFERKIPFLTYYHAPARAWHLFEHLRGKDSWERKLSERYDFHPLTGILATEHLLISEARDVFVTGMTLYRCNGELPSHAGAHSIPPQVQFFRDYLNNPRLKLDASFLNCLN